MPSLTVSSPLGALTLYEEQGALVRLAFGATASSQPTALLEEAARQLAEYFAGARRAFSLPLAPRGTAFQQAVWAALGQIPYGQTLSYADLAALLNRPTASRAVGGACHANPLPVLIPCHRVLGVRGQPTGYAGGLERKLLLLHLERSPLKCTPTQSPCRVQANGGNNP